MKSHKLLSSLLIVSLIVSGMTFSVHAAVDNDTLSYLQSGDKANEWLIMALKASGQSVPTNTTLVSDISTVTDIERKILAVTAAGQDASSYQGANLIDQLDNKRSNNQIGNATLVNDDIWGILAYYSAGVPSSDNRITESRDYLLQYQNSDGGWSHSTVSASDTNDTAMAIIALLRAGISSSDARIANAITYLKSAQNTDGGFGIAPGSESDSASTAWVVSAFQALGQSPEQLSQGGNNPFTYLQTIKAADGGYKWKAQDPNSNPSMTAYVAIAQAGTSYPVHVTTASNTGVTNTNTNSNSNNSSNSTNTNTAPTTVTYRIEGSTSQVCQGTLTASTALEVIEQASNTCGYTYLVENSSFGKYLKSINSDTASGNSGWLYLVDWQQPSVGAADYQLEAGDYVTWYFGEFDWKPTRTVVKNASTAQKDGNPSIEVQYLNGASWIALSDATLQFGNQSKTTDTAGLVSFTVGAGEYDYYATKDGYIRSSKEVFVVSSSGSNNQNSNGSSGAGTISKSLPLTTKILQPASTNNGGGNSQNSGQVTGSPNLSFEVTVVTGGTNQVDFGSIVAGQTASRKLELRNTSDANLSFYATVNGDPVFKDNLNLDEIHWSLFTKQVQPSYTEAVDMSLSIPATYGGEGIKEGDLIIWAKQ